MSFVIRANILFQSADNRVHEVQWTSVLDRPERSGDFEPAVSALATRRDYQFRHACIRAKEVPVSFAPVQFYSPVLLTDRHK